MRISIAIVLVVACSSTASDATTSTGLAESSSSASATSPDPTSSGGEASTSSAADSTTTGAPTRACNGHALLCDRPLDQVTFPTTHNSAAATDSGFSQLNANQTFDLARQLDDGIRGMMLDVTDDAGETVLCHGPCGLGSIPHIDALATIGAFMAAHPDEVLVIIYEDSTTTEAIAADWATAGLEHLLYVHDTDAWPTLGEMIDAGTRIVVTAENGSPPPTWLHHAWELVWDTPYTWHDIREMTCEANRGTPGEGLYLVNHWIGTDADLPDPSAAATANADDVLLARAEQCENEWQHAVNLLAVDFYENGDLLAVVAELNDL